MAFLIQSRWYLHQNEALSDREPVFAHLFQVMLLTFRGDRGHVLNES